MSTHGTYPTLNYFLAGRGGVLHTVPYTARVRVRVRARVRVRVRARGRVRLRVTDPGQG